MIVSASRRTDLPAFFSEWFCRRLEAGEMLLPNPVNPRQVSHVRLDAGAVDAFVFWSKNPGPLLQRFDRIERTGIPVLFHYTITDCPPELEPGVPPRKDRIALFRELARRLSPEQAVWRFDPLIFTPQLERRRHLREFRMIAGELAGSTRRVVVSFLDFYRKIRTELAAFGVRDPSLEEKCETAFELAEAAAAAGLEFRLCAEPEVAAATGLSASGCIDPALLERITGRRILVGKDPGQRPACGCALSVDIGSYHCCRHRCRDCYANRSTELKFLHDPDSPLLLGRPEPGMRISERRMEPAFGEPLPDGAGRV